jgi:diaminopimelate decarboxylase
MSKPKRRPARANGAAHGIFASTFTYRDGELQAEDVRLSDIAERFGTPTYVYSTAALVNRYRAFAQAFAGLDALVCYSLKANSNQAVIATLGREGSGVDIVSGGELRRALAAGIPPERIVFAGIGKTRAEIDAALAAGIHQFNVESLPELELLSAAATARGTRAPVGLRINPDVDARTHAKITTGKAENKFGIDLGHAADVARTAAKLPGIDLKGLAVHIGSQLTSVKPFAAAFRRVADLTRLLRAGGIALTRLDLGGGLGVVYKDEKPLDLASYATAVREAVGRLDVEIVLAPGRWLVAEAGVLLARVVYRKVGLAKRFLITDAAMNDLIRPTLYDAWHPIRPVRQAPRNMKPEVVDVVGPVCETGDYLALGRRLPRLAAGDLIAIEVAGAYGAVMSSTYNSRPLSAEVMVDESRVAVVRPRPHIDELIALDRLPPWLSNE